MLNCQHHISWVRSVAGGLHQCILCFQVVTKKDVYPKLEDLPEELQRRWDAHEATRQAPAPAPVPAAVQPRAAPSAAPTAVTAPTPTPTPTATPTAQPPPRAPPRPQLSAPPAIPSDPRSGG